MSGLTDTVVTWIAEYGLYAVFVLSVVDAVLPAASEVVMVYAGAVAIGAFPDQHVTFGGDPVETTAWAFLAVAIAGTIGYALGSIGGWAIGRYGGRRYLDHHGRWIHVTPATLARAEDWFGRYGNATVLVARCVPVVRSFISIPAGVVRMPFPRYTVLTVVGTVPWYFGLAALGLAAGTAWERVHDAWQYAGVAVFLLRARRNRLRKALERSV